MGVLTVRKMPSWLLIWSGSEDGDNKSDSDSSSGGRLSYIHLFIFS